LTPTGLDDDDIVEILTQPAALMADLSWLPAYLLEATADKEEEEEGAAGGDAEQQGSDISDMSFFDLARVSESGSHTYSTCDMCGAAHQLYSVTAIQN